MVHDVHDVEGHDDEEEVRDGAVGENVYNGANVANAKIHIHKGDDLSRIKKYKKIIMVKKNLITVMWWSMVRWSMMWWTMMMMMMWMHI